MKKFRKIKTRQQLKPRIVAVPKNPYVDKILEANKLMNEESNRLITWSLSLFGGSIAIIISTGYVNPTGYILYTYGLFAVGWVYLGLSIYHGETLTRIYIAGITIDENDKAQLMKNGTELDKNFARQIGYFKYGIFTFALWLVIFLMWFIVLKN